MPHLTICKGLPASGKSTWARTQARKHGAKRVNKDDLRAMLDDGVHTRGNEKLVLAARDALIRTALDAGRDVIVDDTNFAAKHETRIRQIADDYDDVTVEVRYFDVDVDEAIRRDLDRPNSVGERVIRRLYEQYLAPQHRYEPDPTLPDALIVDLDGTLALMNGRNPYDAGQCEQDLVNEPVAAIVRRFAADGYRIVACSGREDTFRPHTERWLARHDLPYDALHMRAAGDHRKDSVVKEEIFDEAIASAYAVRFVLDDRRQVVDMWRARGLTCLQVAPGEF